ncbi:hypothetical protein CPB83DRAFT_885927 [Crepidotus variabilis]|uniref:Uncharacterized protein n=1 Tax=Crepidotus variabilis TaxID=179855 RepID=A0A9P6E9E1_9AGAR|nr:hypothetical protein CPB83DRAFT_885927 [Crepidotus variabilis]
MYAMRADTASGSYTANLLATDRATESTPIRHITKKLPCLKTRTPLRGQRRLGPSAASAEHSVSVAKKRKLMSPPRRPSSPNDVFMSTPWRQTVGRDSKPTSLNHGVCLNTPQQMKAKLALQQHDRHHDAIVVSTLPQYPFHCHEELLSMSGSQLRGVAAQFNARLPINSRLTTSGSTSSNQLRVEIEKLVGIVQEDGSTQFKLQISQPPDLANMSDGRLSPPPSSPLAKHASRKRNLRVLAPALMLESVAEEEVTLSRSLKRRRVSKNTSGEPEVKSSNRF